jgi:hypothetical protein
MLMSIDACFKCWMPALVKSLGAQRAREACDGMRQVIQRAQTAELEGRIKDMQPLMSRVNTSESIAQGYFHLEIRYCPVVDGVKQPPTSWRATVLKPEEEALAA